MPSIRSARVIWVACAALLALALSALPAGATSRIKDLANIEGVRQNQLIGYGLVVGLNGTGDTLNNIPFTKQSLQAMLERMGVNIRGATIRTGNVAAVMVTGNLPAFGTQGTRMDVTVSALGDAKNLQGGTLLVTPLLGADGNVYAVAQGSVAIAGFPGRRRRRQRHPRRADRRPHRQRRHHRARDRVRAQSPAQCAAGAAQRRLHHRQAHRRGGQRFPRRQDRRADRSLDRAAGDPRRIQGQRRRLPDRDRAVAGRAGSRRQDRDRRTLRHHRDGPRRPRRHRRGGAGQPHRLDFRKPASQPAQSAVARPNRGDAELQRQRSAKTARSSRW